MRENQATITGWAIKTFGPPSSMKKIVDRFVEEVIELDTKASKEKPDIEAIKDECADCLIVLVQVASVCGFSLAHAVDKKMEVNRARKWALKGDGTAQHVD
jgi:NTP pyrophosphatase (non-canonical NTP hydrolase)